MAAIVSLPKPHENQWPILRSEARFKVLMCGRRFGKSVVCKIISMLACGKGKSIAYITPTYLLSTTFFDELCEGLPEQFKTNRSELTIKLPHGGSIRFFTGERLDNLRGQKFHWVIVDEAAFIPDLEQAWQNAIRPTLTDYKGRALFVSTPRGIKNFFTQLFNRGKDPLHPDWESFKYSTYDNPHIPKEEIDDARRELPTVVFEQEYMANPAENAANPFGSEAIAKNIMPLSDAYPVCFGIDLAKSHDYTVITGLDNLGAVCVFDRFQGDWTTTLQKIRSLPKLPMTIDSTGVGDPIVEQLQNEGFDVEGFKFTSTSKQELMLGLQSAIHRGLISYPDGVITDELSIFEYTYTPTGVKYSAPAGFHDDAVCSLALAWHKFSRKRGTGDYSVI